MTRMLRPRRSEALAGQRGRVPGRPCARGLRWRRARSPRSRRRPRGPARSTPTHGADHRRLGGLGALSARHLIGPRRPPPALGRPPGAKAPGAKELKKELTALGAAVKIAAATVSDRDQVRPDRLDPQEHPLGAVIHAAGALEDATIEALGPGRSTASRPRPPPRKHLPSSAPASTSRPSSSSPRPPAPSALPARATTPRQATSTRLHKAPQRACPRPRSPGPVAAREAR